MDNKQYYEQYDWSRINEAGLKPLIKAIRETVPEDVKSIIDIGCGNGVIVDILSKEFNTLGVDRSESALAFAQSETLKASCDDIPVNDKSFDLVLSTELLEHLEDDVLLKTINEMKRISRKYILITVPNNENIRKYVIKCPKCSFIFNRSYHMRSFNKGSLKALFDGYDCISYFSLGNKVRKYNKALSSVKMRMTPSSSWIPPFWTPNDQRNTMCPKCESRFEYTYKFNLIAMILDLSNIVLSKKEPYWQMMLLQIKA